MNLYIYVIIFYIELLYMFREREKAVKDINGERGRVWLLSCLVKLKNSKLRRFSVVSESIMTKSSLIILFCCIAASCKYIFFSYFIILK